MPGGWQNQETSQIRSLEATGYGAEISGDLPSYLLPVFSSVSVFAGGVCRAK